jgi:ribosomal protein L6P/L9E
MNFISNKVVTYSFLKNKKIFGLVISPNKGWGFLELKQYFLLKKDQLHPIVLNHKSYLSFLTIIFLGFYKGYFRFLKLKGMGYKFIRLKNNIIFKFGFSHRLIYSNYINIYCLYISKYLLRLESRSYWQLINVTNSFTNIRKNNMYKKKGIFLKGSIINIKISSKKSKF